MSLSAWSNGHISRIRNAFGRSKNDSLGSGHKKQSPLSYSCSSLADAAVDETSFVVIDTELTGLDGRRDMIVSIGAVKMTGKTIRTGDSMYELVKPVVDLKGDSVIVHGITPSDLEKKPPIEHVLPKLIEFCGDSIIVGYCPEIDLEFINKEMIRLYNGPLQNATIDILKIYSWLAARNKTGYLSNPGSLYEIAAGFDIPVKGAHNALADAFITAQVFQRVLHAMSEIGITDVAELYRASNPTKVGDALRLSMKTGNM